MTTTADPGTPIFDQLAALFADALAPQSGVHTQPVEPTPCTPEPWFGSVSPPVHSRHSDTTVVMPGVVEGPEGKAS